MYYPPPTQHHSFLRNLPPLFIPYPEKVYFKNRSPGTFRQPIAGRNGGSFVTCFPRYLGLLLITIIPIQPTFFWLALSEDTSALESLCSGHYLSNSVEKHYYPHPTDAAPLFLSKLIPVSKFKYPIKKH